MSKLGKTPIVLPKNVKIVSQGSTLLVEGPKGKLSRTLPPGITVETQEGKCVVKRANDDRQVRAFHGMMRSLLASAVKGVSDGFSRTIVAVGVGYRMALTGSKLTLNVGFSHPVVYEFPKGITGKLDDQTKLTIMGTDKELVGMVADKIRAIKPPEPYKGKGLRYEGETIQLKEGKSGAGGKSG